MKYIQKTRRQNAEMKGGKYSKRKCVEKGLCIERDG